MHPEVSTDAWDTGHGAGKNMRGNSYGDGDGDGNGEGEIHVQI